jgi:hypothetical protein
MTDALERLARNEPPQLALFAECDEGWREEWRGMPEFYMGDATPIQKITVNFATREDVADFAQRIGQSVTPRTDSIWYPKPSAYVAPREFRYVEVEP